MNIADRANRAAFRAYADRAAARIEQNAELFDRAADLFERAAMPFAAAVCRIELAEHLSGTAGEAAAFHARAA